LLCDIIAVMTLHAIGQEAWSLVAGIEKALTVRPLSFR
jgi:hypothetical protein